MLKVNVIAVGKVKEKYFLDGILEYSKRISRFAEFKIIEIAEENYDKVTDALIQRIKEKEAEKILPLIKGYTIAMAIEGKKTTSEGFAKQIKTLIDKGVECINFIIGGSYGLGDEVKGKADYLMSFSDQTFPHTMFRLMLTEQIYRAFSINSGSAYHK